MANTEVVTVIIETVGDMLVYLLPVIGVMTGLTFITSFLLYVTLGQSRRIFRG